MRDLEKSLQLVMLPFYKSPAAYYIIELVCCSCASETPCSSSKCECLAANLACITIGHFQGSSTCGNEHTRVLEESDDEDCLIIKL